MGWLIAALLIAGLNEMTAIALPITLGFGLWSGFDKRRALWALAGSIAGLILTAIAPGNAVRRLELQSPTISIWQAGIAALQATPLLIAEPFRNAPLPVALLALAAFTSATRAITHYERQRAATTLLKALLWIVAVNGACLAANYYATTYALVERSRYVPIAITVVGIALIAHQVGRLYGGFPQLYRLALVGLALAASISVGQTAGKLRTYAEANDARGDSPINIVSDYAPDGDLAEPWQRACFDTYHGKE